MCFCLIQEVLQGLKEAWLENLTNTLCYKQTNVKLERVDYNLLKSTKKNWTR